MDELGVEGQRRIGNTDLTVCGWRVHACETRLAEHLRECSGNAVVVFDEVQKVIPHTLDGALTVVTVSCIRIDCSDVKVYSVSTCAVLLEAMSPRAQLAFYQGTSMKAIDTSNVSASRHH